MTKFLDKIIGDKENFTFEQRMINFFTFLCATFAVPYNVLNIVTRNQFNYDLSIYLTLFYLLFSLVFYFLGRYKKVYAPLILALCLCTFTSVSWLTYSGTYGPYDAVFVAVLATLLIVVKRKLQLFVTGFILINMAALYLVEQKVFDMNIVPYKEESFMRVDYQISVLSLLFYILILMRFYKKSYDNERLNNNARQEEIERQNKILHDKQDVIKKENEKRTNFFMNLAHESKTPLTLITNYLEQYEKKYGSNRELDVIKANFNQLKRNMVNYLELEKLEKGVRAYNHSKACNVSHIIDLKLPMFERASQKLSLKLNVNSEEGLFVDIDEAAFEYLLNVIVENAFKYTPKGGRVSVNVFNVNSRIVLKVNDNGPGIPEEQFKNLQEPFSQIEGVKKSTQGLGIGLSLVRKIVADIEGDMKIRNLEEGGTEVKIEFQKSKSAFDEMVKSNFLYDDFIVPNNREAKTEFIKDHASPNIVVVEDDYDIKLFIAMNLSEKYNIYTASNGVEALEKVKQIKSIHLIISDIMMDEMDGYEFYERIKLIQALKNVPFMFLSARSTSQDRLKGLSKGAVDYISKPFSMQELSRKVDALINQQLGLVKQLSDGEQNNRVKDDRFAKRCRDFCLTKREIEIVVHLSNGEKYKEISDSTNISERTVVRHVQNIYKKCQVNSRVDLLNLLFEN